VRSRHIVPRSAAWTRLAARGSTRYPAASSGDTRVGCATDLEVTPTDGSPCSILVLTQHLYLSGSSTKETVMKRFRRWLVPAILFTLVGAAVVGAQMTSDDWSDIQTLRADLQADRQAVVAENLGLTDAEAPAFWPVYREYRNEIEKVNDRSVKLIGDYAAKYDTMTDTDADAFFKEWLSIEKARADLRDKYVKKVRKVLPGKKAMRYFQIENKLDAVVNIGLVSQIPLVD